MEKTDSNRPRGEFSPLSRRPIAGAAVFLIAGILLHTVIPVWPVIWLIAALIGAAAACGLRQRQIPSTLLLSASILLVGVAVAQIHRYRFPGPHIAQFISDTSRLAELEIEITQPPRVIRSPTAYSSWIQTERQLVGGQVRRVKTTTGWSDVTGDITLTISPPHSDLNHGQTIRSLGWLHRPAPPDNPGQFDWQSYYRRHRILASIGADGANVQILRQGGWAPLNSLRQKARQALEAGFDRDHAIDHALLRALVLGDNDPLIRDIQDQFQQTGTSHHLSISGMHVAVVGGLVFLICRLLRRPPRTCAWAMILVVIIYGLVALPSPPVVRSILLCLAFGFGVLWRRSVDGIQLLSATIFAMLLYDPLDLYEAGFQLSFGTVLGLMIFAGPLSRTMIREDEDQRVLRSFGIRPGRAGQLWLWIKHTLVMALAAGLVAWAVSAPLIIEHFDQLNPWAIPGSLLLAIPVALALIGGVCKIILTLLMPWWAAAWATMAAVPVDWMRQGVAFLAGLPASDVTMPALPVGIVILYFVLLALPMIPTGRRWLQWTVRGGAGAACGTVFMLPLLIGFAPRGGSALQVHLLSVGAGQCAIARLPDGSAVVFDAGSASIPDLRRRCIAPFLRHSGITRIDTLFISHANSDHFSAAAELIEKFGVRRLALPPNFKTHAARNQAARDMLRRAAAAKCQIIELSRNQSITLAGGVRVDTLWPPGNEKLAENDSSLVLRLSFGGKSVLFTGDVQSAAHLGLLEYPASLKSDVLVAPHHGSAEKTTPDLLDAVAAPLVLASNDRTLSSKQRQLDKLCADRTLLRTDRCGAITVWITPDGKLNFNTFR